MMDIKRFFSRSIVRYALAVLSVAAAVLLRHALVLAVGELPTYITFYPAVMLTALLAGLGPGLLATVLAALAADYWLLEPRGHLTIASLADAVGLTFFSGMGVLMSGVAELYRRSRQAAATYEKQRAVQEEQAQYCSARLLHRPVRRATSASQRREHGGWGPRSAPRSPPADRDGRSSERRTVATDRPGL